MQHIGIVKSNTFISLLNWVGIPLIVIYLFCMIIFPWIEGRGDWMYVQCVWDRWQSLNVGMLALTSVIVAFNISKFNASKQRERNFIAARAFLPEALSELTTYFKLSASLLTEAWQRVEAKTYKSPLHAQTPELPVSYKKTFSRCIGFAEPDVGELLAYMLMRLQVHNSRIKELSDNFGQDSTMIILPQSIISYLYRLGELQALTNRTFGFARGLKAFDSSDYVLEDYRNAYSNLGIWPDDFDDLIEFTQRAIERKNNDKEP